ncbi:MAG: sugar ABC transporter permease [Vulcanimicrobiota bacterium]
MLVPWALSLVFLVVLPLLSTFWLSFHHWDFLNTPVWAGAYNYRQLLSDPRVFQSLQLTALFAVLTALSETVGGLTLGLLMHQRMPGIGAFRTLCYLPSLLSGVASTLMGMWLFQPERGLINRSLAVLGVHGPRWLLQPGWALLALWIMTFWGLGRSALLFLAARQAIPDSLYEAAQLEGASSLQVFRHITWPQLLPTVALNLLIAGATAAQSFTGAYVATAGGPMESTTFYVLYLYQVGFQQLRMGYAATLSLLLFAVTFVSALTFESNSQADWETTF